MKCADIKKKKTTQADLDVQIMCFLPSETSYETL